MKTPSHVARVLIAGACLSVAVPYFVGCTATATRQSAGEVIDDSVLTAKVKAALAKDDRVNGYAVSVETYRGVVQLSGFVDSAEERQFAAAVARGVQGVVDVENKLSIKPPPAQTPR